MNIPIVYSHGFGTRSDARGMFTDIVTLFPDREHIQFDYNEIIDERTLRAASLTTQTEKLSEVLTALEIREPHVDLVAHSQGGIIAAMVNPACIRKAIFIAPPPSYDLEYSISKFASKPGAVVDLAGESVMPRSDGSITLVPASYWESVRYLDPVPLYNAFAKSTSLTIIAGNQDDVFKDIEFHDIDPSIRIIRIDGDHNFLGEYRKGLLQLITQLLCD